MEQIYKNRELSWLQFNERVLEEADNLQVPLCERLTFVSIFQSNLDEFFMVRVGSLQDQMLLKEKITDNKTGMSPAQQIAAIVEEVQRLIAKRDEIYERLMKQIEEQGIRIVDFHKIGKEEESLLELYFDQEIAPLISPTVVGRRQPFPFLRNREIYAAAALETKNKKERIGIIPCTNNVFERLIPVPGMSGCYILSEELILHFISKIFKGYTIKTKSLLRVTRNADIDSDALYDEDLDYREFMSELMKERKKLAPVRMELSRNMDEAIVHTIRRYLDLDRTRLFYGKSPLDLSFLSRIHDLLRKNPELFYEKRTPQKSPLFRDGESMIAQIEEGDKLLSYPFESIRPFLKLLSEAAEDEDVVSIKMSLYRVARQSKVVETLIEAAENGKEVVVLVELRARFDEENNIAWSRRLENAGCQVIYGLDGYKVHSKLCLITRKSQGQIQYITQIGTGNYNENTARLYTDLSLMTASEEIGREAARVFQALSKGETVEKSDLLLVAPHCLQNRILEFLDEEIAYAKRGEEAYVGLKLNSLTDKTIMDKLVEASCAGVKIEMIIRGICCLIPGVPGKTEHIRVISIVGRFLEHSRIYMFGAGERKKYYISSADFMTRNTIRRVEVAAPVKAPALRERLQEIFDIMLADNQKSRELKANGLYERMAAEGEPVNAQERLYDLAYERK